MSKIEKSHLVRSSDWISDLNASKSESEVEDRRKSVERKKAEKKKKKKKKSNNLEFFETKDNETLQRSRGTNLESSFRNSTSNESDKKERTQSSSSSIIDKRNRFSRSENVKSIELQDLEEIASRAVDVVVDVHRHYGDTINSPRSNISSKSDEASEVENIFSRTFTEENSKKNEKKINVTNVDNFLVGESLDSIEELNDPSKHEENDDQGTSIESVRSLARDLEEKPRRRKQWEAVQSSMEQVSTLKKPPRKRWSTDTCVIRLPEALGNNSPSSQNILRSSGSSKIPVPTPRSSEVMQKSAFAFDNVTFTSENEEVLRIETDHVRDDTRIEMRRLSDRSTPFSKNLKKKETSSSIENSDEESDVNVSSSSMKRESYLPRRRRKSSYELNLSNGRSNLPFLEDESIKDDDRRKAWRKQKRNAGYSSRDSLPTNDEEEFSSRFSDNSSESNKKDKDRRSIDETREIIEDVIKKKKKIKRKKSEAIRYILVTIHKADMLETDYVTKHPMVKVHVVEEATGNYLKPNCKHNSGCSYLQPMITGKFDFKENRSMIPIWEEELIFEHDFKVIAKTGNEQVLLFFEVVDLLTFAEASFNYDRFGNEGCWYKIAWAFLRTVGTNNVMHLNKKIRLQLYRPQKSIRNFGSRRCEVYNWWKSNKREKYPSSLYVTVTSIDPPKLEPVVYQQLSLDDILDTGYESQKLSAHSSELINLPRWSRLAAQSCKIPNEKYFETELSENGCFFLAFSNDGKYLACVLSEEYNYPIVVYELESHKIHIRFSGHKTFVYSVNWTQDDHYLLSVSSDQTAQIWDVRNKIVQYVQMLPHPSYVYCGKFNLRNSSTIATGCYDRVARIWSQDSKLKHCELSQELEGHEGFVNSLCFQKNGNLLTADNVGVIVIWTTKKNRKMPCKREWYLSKKVQVREIASITINAIILHPLESRLLVHSRDNGLRMIDLAAGVVLQKYDGLKNQRIQSTACISPCGGLIFCGGEDSTLNVWNLDTGKYLARYTIDRTFRAITCVDYHPYDHVLAFSTFGSPASARILKFDKNSRGKDVGLQMMLDYELKSNNRRNDVTSNLPNVFLKERSRSMSIGRRQGSINDGEFNDYRSSTRSRNSTIINVFQETEENGRYDRAKLKLLQLKETEQQLKSRSTSRLYNIIEKIDRILSNTSRSSNDLELGQSFVSKDQERDKNHVENDYKKEKIKSRKSRSSRNTNVDHPNFYVGTSSTSYDGTEVIELKTFHVLKGNESDRDKRRSKSAKTVRSRKVFLDNTAKTFSDSVSNCRKSQERRKGTSNMIKSIFTPGDRSDPSNSVIVETINGSKIDSFSSPESTGTYIVEKAEFERNNDLNSVKTFENEKAFNDGDANLTKALGSDSSLPSNATFTIENEIPIPKPRRNKNDVLNVFFNNRTKFI